jgi:hypothetical protein
MFESIRFSLANEANTSNYTKLSFALSHSVYYTLRTRGSF